MAGTSLQIDDEYCENMKKYSAVLKMDNGELHEDVL